MNNTYGKLKMEFTLEMLTKSLTGQNEFNLVRTITVYQYTMLIK